MRRPLVLVTVAIGWALACGGNSNSPTGPTGNSVKCTAGNLGSGVALAHGTMSAQIDGVTWTADCIGAVVKQLSASVQSLQIVGADYNNDKTRVLGIDVKTGVGTTNVGGLSLLVVALSDAWVGDAKSWSSVGQSSGSLTMTAETNNSATGTFTFTLPPLTVSGASSAAKITNGVFNITF
jgi:hypothetical protein